MLKVIELDNIIHTVILSVWVGRGLIGVTLVKRVTTFKRTPNLGSKKFVM